VIAEDTVTDGQPQSRPLSHWFCSEEWLEDVRQMLGLDAGTLIFKLDLDDVSWKRSGANLDGASRMAGLHGIQQQVEKDLVGFPRMTEDRR
jgi:hypothetical protein